MKIAMTGGTGFIGTQLVRHLKTIGHEVVLIGRNDIKGETSVLKAKLSNAPVVINLAGAPIVHRWTKKYKRILFNSRIKTTSKLIYAIDTESTRLFISASAVGIYDDNGRHTENQFTYADNYLSKICRDWEKEAFRSKESIRTVVFRFGVVLGNGGALNKMLPFFKLGLGGTIGNGKQAYSWVHIQDILRAIPFVIEHKDCNGIYNLTSPNPTTNRAFTQTLAGVLNRKAFLFIPAFILKLIYGQGAIALIKGQSVLPERLLAEGFTFTFPHLKEALQHIIKPQ